MAATRPLIAAEPMFRAPRPEMVSESNLASCACAAASKISEPAKDIVTAIRQRIDLCMTVGILIEHLNRQHFLTFQVKSQNPCRSEEHTSELQSPDHLVCRLLLEKKNNTT